jgi:hypothetical protein
MAADRLNMHRGSARSANACRSLGSRSKSQNHCAEVLDRLDRIIRCASFQDRADLFRSLALEFDERLLRIERQMGRNNEIRRFTDRRGTSCGRFDLKDVEASTTKSSGAERRDDRLVVDEAAARRIHQHSARAHGCQALSVGHVSGLRGQRRMQRDHVGQLEQSIEVDGVGACGPNRFVDHKRIGGDNFIARRLRAVG